VIAFQEETKRSIQNEQAFMQKAPDIAAKGPFE
jgi:hypothetical protein